ncbi:hypothetical protein Unana1_02862 [Umbelopsis nana]
MFVPTIKNRPAETLSQLSNKLETLHISKDTDTDKNTKADPPIQDNDHNHVNEAPADETQQENASPNVTADSTIDEPVTTESSIGDGKEQEPHNVAPVTTDDGVLAIEEEEQEASIEVADHDKDRLIVTLPNGSRYETDRYCPHAGADLKMHGQISLDEYGPEVGPILMCSIHYWEFLLDKEGNSANGWSTIDACRMKDKPCPVEGNGKLTW